jgi:hypothetical protein
MKIYKLLFANQDIDSAERYELVRETKMYVFLRPITREPQFIFRVHKVTLSVKGIKEGACGYKWDVPTAISLIEEAYEKDRA